MTRFIYLVLVFLISAQSLRAEERVIFDGTTRSTLEEFSLFLEDPLQTLTRPGIALFHDAIIGKPGDGNFTAYKFADLKSDDFVLKLIFEIPEGIRYANSGVYLLYRDPRDADPTEDLVAASALSEARAQAASRRARFGEGPFELDYFSHEIQIIAGTDATIPLENHGAGAFYGIDEGTERGQQRILAPQDLNIGDSYEMLIEVKGLTRRTFLRSTNHQNSDVPVSEMTNLSQEEDPVRGGVPTALLLQGFYNNGRDVQLPHFKRITLDER